MRLLLPYRRWLKQLALGTACAATALAALTFFSLENVANRFAKVDATRDIAQALDRNGVPLSFHYHTRWNSSDRLPLYAFPPLLVEAMIASEDKRFYRHSGVDWRARASALYGLLTTAKASRGASTLTEQVVRMLHPRPRSVWAKWLEGFEAMQLEQQVSKEALLEFYLNQVPYASGRRGVVQAARFYFDRDLDTLSPKEILALVVLVRAPSAYDLRRNTAKLDALIAQLAHRIAPPAKATAMLATPLTLGLPDTVIDASHFLRYVRQHEILVHQQKLITTLDAALQRDVQHILDARVAQLAKKNVSHAAAIVVDHTTSEVLAWVVAGDETDIDILATPRQPGSALKPFLYATALMKGWSAATVLNDSPMREAVGTGLHAFRNYSGRFHGPVYLREALGNSLNIPALLAVRFVSPDSYLDVLHRLGFASLTRTADYYDEGLALGVAEVTPHALAGAYATLARGGTYQPLSTLLHQPQAAGAQRIFSPEVSSIIGDILSDPHARALEFGRATILSLPVQTAIKTGTSTDYRDAWAAGYNHRHTVVVWMGNLDRTATDGVTGSTGPALALRSIFAELTRHQSSAPLAMARGLVQQPVCITASKVPPCPTRQEWFVGGAPQHPVQLAQSTPPTRQIELVQPTHHLRIAYDPRIPASHQQFQFRLQGLPASARVRWVLNGHVLHASEAATYDWQVTRGRYVLAPIVLQPDGREQALKPVTFFVK